MAFQKEQEELALLKKEVRAAQPKGPASKGTYAAVAAGKVEVVVNKPLADGLAVCMDSEEESETAATTSLVLTEEFVALAQLLQEPRQLTEEWSAEAQLAKFLPKRAASNNDKLREELEDFKNLMALQLKKMALGSSEATAKKISAIEKKLDSSGSEEEGASLAACELELCKKHYSRAEGLRLARANSGAENAINRADRLEEICSE